MTRIVALLAITVALGCHHAQPTTTPSTPGTTPNAGVATIDGELVAVASQPGAAIKFKLRVDQTGRIVKESLYHNAVGTVPAEIRTKAEQRWAGGTIVRYELERYSDHGRVHEVEVKTAEGVTCELAVKADGTELYQECGLDVDKLPAAVAAKIAEIFPQGKVLEAETKRGPSTDELTVEVEAGGQEFYLRMSPDGTVLAKLVRIPAIFEVPVQ